MRHPSRVGSFGDSDYARFDRWLPGILTRTSRQSGQGRLRRVGERVLSTPEPPFGVLKADIGLSGDPDMEGDGVKIAFAARGNNNMH